MNMIIQRVRRDLHAPPPSVIDFLVLLVAGLAMALGNIPCLLFLLIAAIGRLTITVSRQRTSLTVNNAFYGEPAHEPHKSHLTSPHVQ